MYFVIILFQVVWRHHWNETELEISYITNLLLWSSQTFITTDPVDLLRCRSHGTAFCYSGLARGWCCFRLKTFWIQDWHLPDWRTNGQSLHYLSFKIGLRLTQRLVRFVSVFICICVIRLSWTYTQALWIRNVADKHQCKWWESRVQNSSDWLVTVSMRLEMERYTVNILMAVWSLYIVLSNI